jgi:Tol biopolymer transport system component
VPNEYTGGDIQPVPLASGAVLYTKYGIDDAGHSTAQLWLQPRPGTVGQALTEAKEACSSPSLSRDGSRLAMVCTGGKQTSSIEVASFDGQKLGPRQVVVEGQLAAAPTWSPDGHSLLYIAPGGAVGQFQLWVIQLESPAPSPTADRSGHPVANISPAPVAPKPKLVTSDLDLDATSQPVWIAAA